MGGVRHPLTPARIYWPSFVREAFEEKASIIQADYGISRAEADRIAETVIRSMWETGHLPSPETP